MGANVTASAVDRRVRHVRSAGARACRRARALKASEGHRLMESSLPPDTRGHVMDLYEVTPERLDTLTPSALVESLRRLAEDRPERGPALGPGFNSAL